MYELFSTFVYIPKRDKHYFSPIPIHMKTLSMTLSLIASIFILNMAAAQVTPGDSIHAVKYVINLEDVDLNAKTIDAYTNVTLVPLVDNLDIIQLELMDLTVDSVFVNLQKISAFTHDNEILNIPLDAPISQADTVDVLVYYHGEPFHESWGGFHWSGTSYAYNLGVGISWVPHNLGKAWFPCIDDFTDRAVYEVLATVPENMKAIGGGKLLDVTNNGNGTHTFRWYLDKPVPTYLISIAIGEYELVADTFPGEERDIPITYYVRPADTGKVAGSFARMHQVMSVFEDRFGPYDWHRVGYVGTSLGAMEHATNIAYPNSSINGNSSSEWLYIHELAHMWFGDKLTCDKAEEMWINEGWATFCQLYSIEAMDGQHEFKLEVRDLHASVLNGYHTTLGEYYPINNIPQNHTYTGIATYDKGALTTQALRAYLGDDVFFPASESLLEDYAFQSISSYDMEASFTQNTGIDMSGYFNNWVYNGGTPQYSIDSFSVSPNGSSWDVTVYVKQKRHGPAFIGDGNRIEFSVMGADWSLYTDVVEFDGQAGSATISVPVEPAEVFLDLEEKYADATLDNYLVIDELDENNFPGTYFMYETTEINDSIFMQVTHNYAPADTLIDPVPGFRISDYRYWTIKSVGEDFNGTGRFFYSKSGLDGSLIQSQNDSIVIMWRENAGMEWQPMEFTQLGQWSIGYLFVENMPMGEYVLGVWETTTSTNESYLDDTKTIEVFPNPSTTTFNFIIKIDQASRMDIYSYEGRLVKSINVNNTDEVVLWSPQGLPNGNYIAVLVGHNNESLSRTKLIYMK
jgi:aminopeptidase N